VRAMQRHKFLKEAAEAPEIRFHYQQTNLFVDISINTTIRVLIIVEPALIKCSKCVKAQSKEQNLLVASELDFQDEVWKKIEERTRLYTWRQGSRRAPD
jgi:hypothetical protein